MNGFLSNWLPILLCVVLVWLLTSSALFKLANYPASAEGFASLSIPAPGVMVLLAGAFEGLAAVAPILGSVGRLAGLPVVSITAVAMATAGVNFSNVSVLLGALGIILIGTGVCSLWKTGEKLPNFIR